MTLAGEVAGAVVSASRMPWHETDPVTERLKFVAAYAAGEESMVELCARFGISRKTGYKLLGRYRAGGPEGLRDRSRAAHTRPNQTPSDVEGAILRVRQRFPTWGSKKILAWLERETPDLELPARSTVDAILKRAGVVEPRRRRRRQPHQGRPVIEVDRPNAAWSMDYKGWFRVGDGTRCDPLTVNDMHSRLSIACRALVAPKLVDVRRALERCFRDHGLPDAILSDNGPPFASARGLGRLSRLGVWLLRLGVRPVLIQPGHPEQNGRHERFHATLEQETASPPRATIAAQQAAFTRFQWTYNVERPHEALGMHAPADLYEPSLREMPAAPPDHEYAGGFEVRRVRRDGAVKWAGGMLFVSEVMAGELVGLRRNEADRWEAYLGPVRLGVVHERSGRVVTLAEDVEPVRVTHVPGHGAKGDGS